MSQPYDRAADHTQYRQYEHGVIEDGQRMLAIDEYIAQVKLAEGFDEWRPAPKKYVRHDGRWIQVGVRPRGQKIA